MIQDLRYVHTTLCVKASLLLLRYFERFTGKPSGCNDAFLALQRLDVYPEFHDYNFNHLQQQSSW